MVISLDVKHFQQGILSSPEGAFAEEPSLGYEMKGLSVNGFSFRGRGGLGRKALLASC
jgi:hypothetical protein